MRSRSVLATAGPFFAFALGVSPVAHAEIAADAYSSAEAAGPALASAPSPAQTKDALPSTGSTVDLVEDGDMVLACNGTLRRFDLHGAGRLAVGERFTRPDGLPGVVVTTMSEDLFGYDPVLGDVTVTQTAPSDGEFLPPGPVLVYPAEESFAQNVEIAMEHNPCDDSGAPMTLRTKAPFPLLNANLKAFPPADAVYQLAAPVELVGADAPHDASAPTVAHLLQFPVSVTQIG